MLLLLRPVSLQSPSCPGTTYLDQDAMELIEICPISAFLLLVLKVYHYAWQEPCILKETLKKNPLMMSSLALSTHVFMHYFLLANIKHDS